VVIEQLQFSLPLRHSYWQQDDEQGPLPIEISGKRDVDLSEL